MAAFEELAADDRDDSEEDPMSDAISMVLSFAASSGLGPVFLDTAVCGNSSSPRSLVRLSLSP